MKLKHLLFAVFLLFTFTICAEYKKPEMYVAPTFGIGFSYDSYNAIGFLAGLDIVWKVWENNRKAPGRMLAGIDTGFEYWLPTRSTGIYTNYKRHYLDWPVTGYFSYEFKVNAGPLTHVGPYLGMGLGFCLEHEVWDNINKKDTTFFAAFAGAFGGSLVFANNWVVKQSFTWGAGARGWGSFNIEASYRF